MAHFAQVENGIVTTVIAVSNDEVPNESTGQAFLASLGLLGEWVQTSYNGNPIEGQDRGGYAGIGYTWDGTTFTPETVTTDIEETP
jgi:sulfur carrier protein ThiS